MSLHSADETPVAPEAPLPFVAAARGFARTRALLPTIVVALCATQLCACVGATRDGVPTQYMASAEVRGYPQNIREWGDSYASYSAGRLVVFHNERLKAARTDPAIKLNELNALTLSGGGSSGAF